jgi:two-component system sensor kinase FixL
MHPRKNQVQADAAMEALIVAQDRLMRVARLATMGEMATCVAHELNQPLTAITTYARACERYLAMPQPDLEEARAALREISTEGLRAGEVIRRLRQMVRSDEPEVLAAVDVNDIVEDLRTLLAADARAHGAELCICLTAGLPRISANPVQLQHVLINLARNAFEAVRDSHNVQRRVEIATAFHLGDEVEICVSDNGPGVAAEIRDRLFDPFASTKGSGTGLGLAVSRTIVKSHGGTIGTRRDVARGATFYMRFPVLEDCLP